jgi:drug/metabolite transporter (DMT)-like permease
LKHGAKYFWHTAAIVTIAIWGTTFVSTKVLIQNGLSPAEIFTYRFLVAYIVIWFFSPRKLFADSWRDELLMAAVGFTGGSLYFITENTALETTLASNVSLLVCTAPVWTALLSRIFYPREGLGGRLWSGILVAMAGSALVVFNGSFVLELNPIGDLLSIAAALSWAVYSLVMRGLGGRYSVMFITRKVFFWGLVTLLPFLLLPGTDYHPAALAEPAVWGNLLFLGLVASLVCFAVWNRVIKEIGVVASSNYIYLNPVFTMSAAALVLGERITWIAVVGLVLIAAGLWLAERVRK